MKKQLLSIVIILAMILNLLVLPVLAEGTLTLSVPDVEAKAGEEVKVTVNVSNNTGLASLKVNVNYDSVLTLTGVEFNSAFGSMVTAPEPFANPEPLTMISPLSDISANGVFATLTFKVDENAQNGYKANITLTYDADDIYDGNYDNVPVTIINGSVIIEGEPQPTGTITGATLDIGSSLTINYLAEAPENAKMKFTSSSGRVTEVNGAYDEKTGYYKFAYAGINPQCMGDTLKAELMVEETVLDTKENYSIQSYCENQIAKSASELGFSEHQFEAFKTLLADMLAYGSASQEYKNYNADALVDGSEWVSRYKTSFTAPEGVKAVTGNADADNKVKSVGLNMANVNRIYFKLILNDDVVIKLNGNVVDKENLIEKDGVFTLYTDAIFATQFGEVYTLELVKGEETITTVQYNVNAYIQAKHGAQGLEKIVKALSNYGTSAVKYQKSIIEGEFDLEDDIL